MACLVARQGRELQRYTSTGGRVVVGCIPYKFKFQCDKPIDQAVEVLVISSQKGHGMMFPKGGWESDESIHEAVCREALEEAGVQGHVEVSFVFTLKHAYISFSLKGALLIKDCCVVAQSKLGNWNYTSRRCGLTYEGMMFPLNVTEELGQWPEMHARKRRWVTAAEARAGCQHVWMIEALDSLVARLKVPACLDDRRAG
ncbi:Nudix hydrolase 17, mitochondrial [Ananas comosus]|uniref:Nudix hydrolase 17, mitochondrial n=1 Tax=Ananas comosus TaxID=4615 RepID=A0A199VQJ9_ANACO|nr:Nudix hydrolase 17, mitochondrial [Ananas comosus]